MSAIELGPNLAEEMLQWRVLLMYEDLSTGLRAKEAFDHAVRELQEQAESQLTLWKFDLLEDPQLREIAAHEAALADIVIISAHGGASLPTAVETSLREAFRLGRDCPKALVASLDVGSRNSESANRFLARLADVAAGTDVCFLLHFGRAVPAIPNLTIEEIHRRAETKTDLLEHILERTEPHLRSL